MSEWLKKVVDDVDRQFQELPDWKKRNSNKSSFDCSAEEEKETSTVQEPKSD